MVARWDIVQRGSLLGWANFDAEEAGRMQAEREAEVSADVRFAVLATEGISAEVVYQTIGLRVCGRCPTPSSG